MILKVLCVIFLIESCDSFRFSWNDISSIILRGTKCPQELPFTLCRIGQCLDIKFSCDAKANCDDYNDIEDFCWNVTCHGLQYRCKYGSCSDVKAKCNKSVECFYGSDGNSNLCNSTSLAEMTVETRRNCILPQHPDFGQWSISGRQDIFSPGQSVEDGTVLKVDCNKSHILDGAKDILCENGKWSTNIGRCSKICRPRISTESLKVTCIYKNKESENCTEAVDGTFAKFKCAPFFENTELNQSPVHLCQDGKWNQTLPRCRPACGGSTVNRRTYPWQAAVYNHDSLYCSGSLISQRIILSAAHCVTDNEGKLYAKDNFTVAVGKLYSSFNDSRDQYAQFSELEAMFVPEAFKGDVQNYLGDIAILVAKKTFTLSRRTQPVCLQTADRFRVFPDDYGYVGWLDGVIHVKVHILPMF